MLWKQYVFVIYSRHKIKCHVIRASLVAQTVKRLSTMRETRFRFLGRKDPLEKEMAIHSFFFPGSLAWKTP